MKKLKSFIRWLAFISVEYHDNYTPRVANNYFSWEYKMERILAPPYL